LPQPQGESRYDIYLNTDSIVIVKTILTAHRGGFLYKRSISSNTKGFCEKASCMKSMAYTRGENLWADDELLWARKQL
jgi:hypothetical protein